MSDTTADIGAFACDPPFQQLTFGDVADVEVVIGDAEYTAWLQAGRPSLEQPPVEPDQQA